MELLSQRKYAFNFLIDVAKIFPQNVVPIYAPANTMGECRRDPKPLLTEWYQAFYFWPKTVSLFSLRFPEQAIQERVGIFPLCERIQQ